MERFISYGVDMFIMRSSDILNKIQIKCNRDGAAFIMKSYKNSKTPFKFKFKCRCGTIKETTWASLWKDRCYAFCEKCSKFEFSKKQMDRVKEVTFNKIQEFCDIYNIVPMFETYRGYNKEMSFKCLCGRIFNKSWSDLKHKNGYTYCNICKKVYGESKSKNVNYHKNRPRILNRINDFCDKFGATPCFEYYKNRNTQLKVICKCGQIFYQSYLSMRMGRAVLCNVCYKELMSGENHHLWNHSLTYKERLRYRYLPEFVEWSKEIKRINNYTCQITGVRGGDLVSHHLYSWDTYIDKRFDLNNGVCIQKKIHKKFHNLYGYGNNTSKQFEEFVTEFKGG